FNIQLGGGGCTEVVVHPTVQGGEKHTSGGGGVTAQRMDKIRRRRSTLHQTKEDVFFGVWEEEKERRKYIFAKMGKGAHSTNTIQRQIRVTCSDLGLNLIQSLPSPKIIKGGERRPLHIYKHGKITLLKPENIGRGRGMREGCDPLSEAIPMEYVGMKIYTPVKLPRQESAHLVMMKVFSCWDATVHMYVYIYIHTCTCIH
ncbi:UNVERIFIED_CONTAM: hypothetical protein K2H54_031758, partial [Gekko kuhli]